MALTIVVADASSADRGAFREAIKGTGYEVVADAAHGDALVEAVAKLKPWCVAFDLLLPGHADRGADGGVNVMKRVRQKCPGTKFLALHTVQTSQLVMGALSDGAGARARKPIKREALVEALAKLGEGKGGTATVKQAAVRFKKALPLKYKLATDGFFTKKREVMTSDVSEVGIGLVTEEKLSKTALLNVELELTGEAPLSAKMQVARVAQVPGLPRFDVGLVFIGMDPALRERLKKFIARGLERATAAPPTR